MKKLTPEKLKKILSNYSYDYENGVNDLDAIIEILVDLALLDPSKFDYGTTSEDSDGEA